MSSQDQQAQRHPQETGTQSIQHSQEGTHTTPHRVPWIQPLTRRQGSGSSSHRGPALLLGTWSTLGRYWWPPRKTDHLKNAKQESCHKQASQTTTVRDSWLKGHRRERAREGQTWLWACGNSCQSPGGKPCTWLQPRALTSWAGGQALTHFTDSEGAGIAGIDLGCTTAREVEQFHQARNHLVLLLSVAQPAVATEAPGEDSLL